MNVMRLFRATTTSLVIATALLAGGTGCVSDRQVIAQAADAHRALEPAVITDEVLANYLQEVGDRIVKEAQRLSVAGDGPPKHFDEDNTWMFGEGVKFHFVNSKTLNAFTTGGEHMYIYTQLFLECETEDELAAVMAHEFAHIYGRHVQKGTNRQLPILIGGTLVGAAAGYALAGDDNRAAGAGIGAGLGAAGGQFVNMGFTRGDESEADDYGFKFYTRAGWDPERFGDFFQRMIDKGYDKTPGMLSDHPTLRSRVDNAKERAADLPPEASEWRRDPVAGARRFKELQARAERLGKTLPNDTSLESARSLLQALPRSCVSPIEQFEDQKEAQDRLARRAEQQNRQN